MSDQLKTIIAIPMRMIPLRVNEKHAQTERTKERKRAKSGFHMRNSIIAEHKNHSALKIK